MTLVLGMMVVGCNNGTTDNVDTWSYITDLNQLDGLWKINNSRTMTIQEWYATYNGPSGATNISLLSPQQLSALSGKNITSIEVTTPPTKMNYTIGESFDPSGMVITVNLVNTAESFTIPLNELGYYNYNFYTAGTTSVVVMYMNVPIAVIEGITVGGNTSAFYGNIKVTYQYESYWTFNINSDTALLTGTTTMYFSGGNINNLDVWNAIKKNYVDAVNFTVNDANKSLINTYTWTEDIGSNLESIIPLLQINQDGTRLLIPAEVMEYFDDLVIEDEIAIKQL